jgi:hypothetical protein
LQEPAQERRIKFPPNSVLRSMPPSATGGATISASFPARA